MTPRRSAIHARYRARVLAEARVWHAHLLHVLGGKCFRCGDDGSNAPLSVEHVFGRRWEARSLRLDERVKRYWREFNSGVFLRVLCIPCNGADGYFWSQH